jgi:hypothetical protein
MTQEKLNHANRLKKEIEQLENRLKSMLPSKQVSLPPYDKVSVSIRCEVTLEYSSPQAQYGSQKDTFSMGIPSNVAEFFYKQKLNELKAELHVLKTKFEKL